MIDREHLDQAGLYTLELLDEAERADFERELRVNPRLRMAVREASDLAASVALTAPLAQPSARNLAIIQRRISGQPRRWPKLHPAWGVAAVLAVLVGWLGMRHHQTSERLRLLQGREKTFFQPGADGNSSQETETARLANGPSSTTQANRRRGPLLTRDFGPADASLVQDAARLRSDLQRLRAAQNDASLSPAGVADLRLMEMREPGKVPTKEGHAAGLLPARMADAIAAGLKNPPSDGKQELRLSGQGASPTDDIFIDKGMVNLNALQLHPDARVVHRDFPQEEEFGRYGLSRVDVDNVWDGQGWMWHRGADGQWVGQRVPDGWQPPDPDDPQPVVPPPLRPKPGQETSQSAESTGPYALPIIDTSNGSGRLIVQNLPLAPDGQVYQLWLIDPRFDQPIGVGVLPPMNARDDHFSFDLGGAGFLPSGYLLTLEKPGNTATPAGQVVLQGP